MYFLIILTFIFSNIFANEQNEKIYAVMVTGKDEYHEKLALNSVKSFLEQTYTNKHLIIVNDGKYSLGNINKDLITEIKLEKKYNLGKLRNIGLNAIPEGAIYLQWDDDDWHHHNLMQQQYDFLKANNADSCLLKNQVQYAFKKNTAWLLFGQNGIPGTIMCKKFNNISYPEMQKSEDLYFMSKYSKDKTVVWNNPEHYYLRFIHCNNTWDDNHFFLNKKTENKFNIPEDSKLYLTKILPLYSFVKINCKKQDK